MRPGWVYIMTNAPYGTLYTGVTGNLAARITQHRDGVGSIFCKKHGLTKLIYVEAHDRIDEAIVREKAIKAWRRKWKIELIVRENPQWIDLFDQINA